jgi:hypothetical protein
MGDSLRTISLWILLPAVAAGTARACPFCAAPQRTLAEELTSMDAVVIARLTRLPPAAQAGTPGSDVPSGTFQIVDVIKGDNCVRQGQTVQTLLFGGGKVGDQFLIMGVNPPQIAWSTAQKVTDRAIRYVRTLGGLPEKGPARLAFFQDYLEDPEPLLARDAYDEFARAPYAEVQGLKDRMRHDELVARIKDVRVPASRRRLYLVMLSVCGGAADVALLEGMLQSPDRKVREGLDAMIGCYLLLTGPAGMPLIEHLFLKSRQAEYADTYSAITALRFHGSETNVIPRERILEAFRHLLDRPQLADLVIPDLARWRDWTQLDRLARLFKEADASSSYVRVPVINYLRVCPDPKAKRYLEELQTIDPEAFQRANVFSPFGGARPAAPAGGTDKSSRNGASRPAPRATAGRHREIRTSRTEEVAAAGPVRFFLRAAHERFEAQVANPMLLLTVIGILGAALMFAQWRILSGAGRRY